MSGDLHALAGLYALDALGEADTARFERHLERCEQCRAEVAGFREAAHLMGASEAVEPPLGLRARTLEQTFSTVQQRPVRPRSQRWAVAASAVGTAAAVAAVVALSVALGAARSQLRQASRIADLLADPAVEVVTYRSEDGVVARLAAEPTRDELLVALGNLPAIDDDRAYAIWLIDSVGPTPMALVTPDDSGRAIAFIRAPLGSFVGFGLTNEPADGSPRPTGPILVAGELPASTTDA